MDNNKVLTKVLRELTISIEGAKIPILHKGIEEIVMPCYEGCVIDVKFKMSSNKGGGKIEG
jgi:hypothetical protein